MKSKWYKKLHWQIIIGLVLGLFWGLLAGVLGMADFTSDYIRPVGTIFIDLLRVIAVPLVLASLVVGVSSLNDITRLSKMGGKTVAIYLITTMFAITIGLTVVNIMQPGGTLPDETRASLMESYGENVEGRDMDAEALQERTFMEFFVDIVPENVIDAASDNSNMLQIVFVAILLGIGIVNIPAQKGQPLVNFFESLNDVIIKIVDLIMKTAPYGVFALMAAVIVDLTGDDLGQALILLRALGWYCLAVVIGLILHVLIVYSSLFKLFS